MTTNNKEQNPEVTSVGSELGGAAIGADKIIRKSVFPSLIDILALFGVFMMLHIASQWIAMWIVGDADTSLLLSSNDNVSYFEQVKAARYSFVRYVSLMLPFALIITIYSRVRGVRGRLVGFSSKGLDPSQLLWSVLLIVSVGVLTDPLISLLPRVPEYVGRGRWALLSLIVAAPILEEYICRGVMLNAMRRRYGTMGALFGSSLFFAMLHIHPTMIVNAFIMGILLGFFYIRTNSLIAPIILHAINNSLAYLLIYMNYSDVSLSDVVTKPYLYYIIYCVALVFFVISMVKILRKINKITRLEGATYVPPKSDKPTNPEV